MNNRRFYEKNDRFQETVTFDLKKTSFSKKWFLLRIVLDVMTLSRSPLKTTKVLLSVAMGFASVATD